MQPLKNAYRNWGKGEPNNFDKIEHVLGAFTSSGRWNDFKTSGTSREAAYVCERGELGTLLHEKLLFPWHNLV